MDAALDSPLEALALNYLAYGFLTAVNNIWAWIAVVTAAVSFWRMRALSPPPQPSAVAEAVCSGRDDSAEEEEAAAPVREPCRVLEREGSTKMKFSVYYKEEEEEEEEGLGGEDDDGGGNEDCGGGEAEVGAWRWGDWEGVVEMRMGDMGWYSWQDRTVLDGSVVRLWDGRRRLRAAAVVANGGGGAW